MCNFNCPSTRWLYKGTLPKDFRTEQMGIFFSVKSPLNRRVNLKFGCTVLWQHNNTQISGLLFFGYLLLATEAEKQDYIQLLSTRQESCCPTHTVVVWGRCNLRLNINMLVIPDATTQRTCSPNKVNTSWLKCWPCSCRIAIFLFNFPFLRIYIPFRMCHLFFPSNCWWFQVLDLKCCWLLLTQQSLFCFYILILHEVIAYMHFHLQSDDYSTTLIFPLLKLGYGHAISLPIYKIIDFSKIQKICYKFKYTVNTIDQHLLTYVSMMTVRFLDLSSIFLELKKSFVRQSAF